MANLAIKFWKIFKFSMEPYNLKMKNLDEWSASIKEFKTGFWKLYFLQENIKKIVE